MANVPIINLQGETHEWPTGCYVDGHWGQYGASRVLTIADDVLGTTYKANALYLSGKGDDEYEMGSHVDELASSESMSWDAEKAESALNDETPEGYVWHWHDGEFFLSPLCAEGDCADETCAHWD